MDKPKKPQLKQQASSSVSSSSSSSMAPPTSTAIRQPPPSYRSPNESFARRYKFLWPILLAVNFSIGACILLMPMKKDEVMGEVEGSQLPSASVVAANSGTSQVAENKEFHP